MCELVIKKLSIRRPDGVCLLEDLDLTIQQGEVMTIMGVSGVGKSTVLNWLIGADLARFQTVGEAWLDGKRIDQLPTEQRQVGILFQDDLLFPHFSVADNLSYALPASISGRKQRRAKIDDALASAGLEGFGDRDPATLSGGQRARVSLMRALLAEPKALLMDEPFSKLDTELRQRFRQFVYQRIDEQGIPSLLVTHDASDIPIEGRSLELTPAEPEHV